MNLCFIQGKIIEEVDFKFTYKDKNISIAKSKIELHDKSSITIIGYNEMADLMYRKLKVNSIVIIQGKLRGNNRMNMIAEVHTFLI